MIQRPVNILASGRTVMITVAAIAAIADAPFRDPDRRAGVRHQRCVGTAARATDRVHQRRTAATPALATDRDRVAVKTTRCVCVSLSLSLAVGDDVYAAVNVDADAIPPPLAQDTHPTDACTLFYTQPMFLR